VSQTDLPLNGLLIVDKPGLHTAEDPFLAPLGDEAFASLSSPEQRLPTSHDIVQRVRRLAHQRRIGHTGTLDPMASGVLVLCLGWATRLVEFYQGHDKQYRAAITLGFATDTYDLLGHLVERKPVPPLTTNQIEELLRSFVGTIEQRPPQFSALKQGGESLHRKARRGEVVEVPLREITIHSLDLLAFHAPATIEVRVRCSAGAYIRSLAVDIGQALGTVATLSALRREAAGAFTLAHAHSLPDMEDAAAKGQLATLLLAPGTGLDMPTLVVDAATALRLGQGQRTPIDSAAAIPNIGPVAQACSPSGHLLGIVRQSIGSHTQPALWQAEKWFASQDNAHIP